MVTSQINEQVDITSWLFTFSSLKIYAPRVTKLLYPETFESVSHLLIMQRVRQGDSNFTLDMLLYVSASEIK